MIAPFKFQLIVQPAGVFKYPSSNRKIQEQNKTDSMGACCLFIHFERLLPNGF
jgi:hypothetical protein